MKVELKNEITNDSKIIEHGINYYLMITAPIFGITLFKNKLKKSALLMLILNLLLLLIIIMFIVLSNTYANMNHYGSNPEIYQTPSFLTQIFYMLDIDYSDMVEFCLTSFLVIFVAISIFAIYIGIYANKWIVEELVYNNYKIKYSNTAIKNRLMKDWGLSENEFIYSEIK